MPCISGQYDPAVGVLLQVAFLPGGHLIKENRSNSEESPIGVMGVPVSGLRNPAPQERVWKITFYINEFWLSCTNRMSVIFWS